MLNNVRCKILLLMVMGMEIYLKKILCFSNLKQKKRFSSLGLIYFHKRKWLGGKVQLLWWLWTKYSFIFNFFLWQRGIPKAHHGQRDNPKQHQKDSPKPHHMEIETVLNNIRKTFPNHIVWQRDSPKPHRMTERHS